MPKWKWDPMNRQCRVCGRPLYGRSDKLYCSSRCRRAASRAREQVPKTDPDPQFLLGGVEVDERVVRDLIPILDRPLARKLDMALLSRAKMVGLSSHERMDVLAGLAHAHGDLQDLRELLLTDPHWRRWELSAENLVTGSIRSRAIDR